ncbi:MAG: hypothetical protein GVY36_19260 [Verrucomicrobia bacterium]|nr:hypothetical protein [Verrucomicrobiota bacterium]
MYTREYVDRIEAQGVEVIRDERWPGWWSKMAALEQGGPFILCDLDTIFVGQCPIPTELTMLRDFYRPQLAQSGLMYVTAYAADHAWREWIKSPESVMGRYRGDGEFLRDIWSGYRFWQDDYPGKVVSYKVHCQNETPKDAAVICYHGKPRPHETGWATDNACRYRTRQ